MGSLFGRIPLMSVAIGARFSPILHSFVHYSVSFSPYLGPIRSLFARRFPRFRSLFGHNPLSLCHHVGAYLLADAPLLGRYSYIIWPERPQFGHCLGSI